MGVTFYHGIGTSVGWEQETNSMAVEKLNKENLLSVVRFTHKKILHRGGIPVLSEEEATEALRQYYALPILEYPRQQFAISGVVDEYWRRHVLETGSWYGFCRRVYGSTMYRVPINSNDHQSSFVRVRDLYSETRTVLVGHFGNRVNERAYPLVNGDGCGVAVCSYDSRVNRDRLYE